MTEDEAILIFADQDAQAQFHRDAGLALGEPLGMGLKNGEDLFGMRDALAVQHPAPDLIALALGMGEMIIPGRETGGGPVMHCVRGGASNLSLGGPGSCPRLPPGGGQPHVHPRPAKAPEPGR